MNDWIEIINDGNIYDKAIFVGVVVMSLVMISITILSIFDKI